ncbi:hypothetical protein QNZ93_004527 [Vibrio parahaemolyticus]|nr:hypothetical protein [Vibrio parahaemolyticus]ELB2132481.1 hypothetical protein [Vibrio parahaemolyticus]ELB2147373.1 hypothetical protein [Vibrio parahaemolyticus]ELB2239661.1 hypothetical protein [Vibrio parahaemolyticus]
MIVFKAHWYSRSGTELNLEPLYLKKSMPASLVVAARCVGANVILLHNHHRWALLDVDEERRLLVIDES